MFSTTKSKLISDPNRIAAKEKRATGDKKRPTNASSSSVMATDKDEKERAATINTVLKALQLYPPAPDRGGAVSFPDNVSNANVSAASTGAAAVTQIFDHNGDPI